MADNRMKCWQKQNMNVELINKLHLLCTVPKKNHEKTLGLWNLISVATDPNNMRPCSYYSYYVQNIFLVRKQPCVIIFVFVLSNNILTCWRIFMKFGTNGRRTLECVHNLGFRGWKSRRMLRNVRNFDSHCSCHLQGEYIVVGRFWKPYILYRAGSRLCVGFNDTNCWSGRAVCYQMGEVHMV